jgi:hypothetical protein
MSAPEICPYDQQPPPVTRRPPGPGDVLAAVIRKLGFSKTCGCGCAAMQDQMNDWGWLGCFERRDDILAFMKTKADTAGVPFDEATVWAAVKAALWAWHNPPSPAAKPSDIAPLTPPA